MQKLPSLLIRPVGNSSKYKSFGDNRSQLKEQPCGEGNTWLCFCLQWQKPHTHLRITEWKKASLDRHHVVYLIVTDKPVRVVSTQPTVVSWRRGNSMFLLGFVVWWWQTLLSVSGRHKRPSFSVILWRKVWIIHKWLCLSLLFYHLMLHQLAGSSWNLCSCMIKEATL